MIVSEVSVEIFPSAALAALIAIFLYSSGLICRSFDSSRCTGVDVIKLVIYTMGYISLFLRLIWLMYSWPIIEESALLTKRCMNAI